MKYEILPHTADLRIRAYGASLSELFRNALRGLGAVLQPEALARRPEADPVVSLTAPHRAWLRDHPRLWRLMAE
jgi:SHS2 domain-containing protein